MNNLIAEEFKKWIESFVEKPNPLLNNWPPCPYARQARINDKIVIVESNVNNLITDIESNLHLLKSGKEVIAILFDHRKVDPQFLIDLVKTQNKVLMPANFVILEDHPDLPEFVNGVNMNFGKCGLLLVQCLDKLNNASIQLKLNGYYERWDTQAIDNVVTWRFL